MGMTRDPKSGAIQWATALAGPRRYGANRTTTATSGTLPREGYDKRSYNLAVQKAIQKRLAQFVTTGQSTAAQAGRIGRGN